MVGFIKSSGNKCSDSVKGNGDVDVKSCVKNTAKPCTLSKGEVGSQEVKLENIKRHAADTEITFRSQNQSVCFSTDSTSPTPTHNCEVTVGKRKFGENGTLSFNVNIEQSSNPIVSEESIDVEIEYEHHKSNLGLKSGPIANLRVDLE